MKKLILLFGVAIGYVTGSAAGRERYEQIRSMTVRVKNNPQVQAQASKAADAAKDAAPVVKDKVSGVADSAVQKVKGDSSPTSSAPTSSPTLEDSAYPKATPLS